MSIFKACENGSLQEVQRLVEADDSLINSEIPVSRMEERGTSKILLSSFYCVTY